MANNRAYLQCHICRGDAFYLAKWYPGSGWYRDGEIRLTEWLESHTLCALEVGDDRQGACFELLYEMDVQGAPACLYPSKARASTSKWTSRRAKAASSGSSRRTPG